MDTFSDRGRTIHGSPTPEEGVATGLKLRCYRNSIRARGMALQDFDAQKSNGYPWAWENPA